MIGNGVLDFYGLDRASVIDRDGRGLINEVYFIDDNYVFTLYKNRTYKQVSMICEIVGSDPTGLFPSIVRGKSGAVCEVKGNWGLLCRKIPGRHYIGVDHSKKDTLSSYGHHSVARAFFRVHKYLASCSLSSFNQLGRIKYSDMDLRTEYGALPSFLRTNHIKSCIDNPDFPELYSSIVHCDMERQNLLHAPSGKVIGVVDTDALLQGDVLYEFGHCMLNFAFCDPKFSPDIGDIYIQELVGSNMINVSDCSLLPVMMKSFASKVLIFYYNNRDRISIDLPKLSTQYTEALDRVDGYFASRYFPARPSVAFDAKRTLPSSPERG